jgi:peptidoglycan biosynthesis protein MviN/MurJ (putative lipid II flippase)
MGVNIGLNVVLVSQFGWVGAAVATVISAAVGLVLAFRYLYGLLMFELPIAEIGRQCVAATVMGAVVFAIRQLFEASALSNNVVIVLSLIGVGAASYFVLLSVISQRFRSIVVDNLSVSVLYRS